MHLSADPCLRKMRYIYMTLLVLAAGMGSRYGGLKQIDPFTKDGEFIIDFSVYDALRAGLTVLYLS